MQFRSNSLLDSSLFVRWLPLLGFCAVIAQYFWLVYTYAVNIPHWDDIYDFLNFVILAESATSAWDAFTELYRQYNDHRTSASRIVVYATYLAEGEVNFHTLTLIGNLALPLILLLFFLTVRGEKYRWVLMLVSALLLLHLRYFTLISHAQATFAYFYVFFYAFACLFALHKVTPPKFVLAVALGALATFTFAAGQIVWVMGLASLLHQCFITKRTTYIYPAMWLLVSITVLVLWRVGFYEIPSARVLTVLPDTLIDAPFHQQLVRYAAYFFVTIGSAFTDTSTIIAGALGTAILALLIFVTVRFYKQEDIRLALCCWFIVASVAAVALGRALWLPPEYILTTRYTLLSVLLVSTLTLLVQLRFSLLKPSVVYLFVPLAGFYWVWANHQFEPSINEILLSRHSNFNSNKYPVLDRPKGESNEIVDDAISVGIYRPPCKPLPQCETALAE
jgi:hypothetical protein